MAKENKSDFCRYWTRKFNEGHPLRETLVYTEMDYRCIHAGEPKWRRKRIRPIQRTRKTGCPVFSKITGSSLLKELVVKRPSDQHNHALSAELWKFERENRKLESTDMQCAAKLIKKHVPAFQVSLLVERKLDSLIQIIFRWRDGQNFVVHCSKLRKIELLLLFGGGEVFCTKRKISHLLFFRNISGFLFHSFRSTFDCD